MHAPLLQDAPIILQVIDDGNGNVRLNAQRTQVGQAVLCRRKVHRETEGQLSDNFVKCLDPPTLANMPA